MRDSILTSKNASRTYPEFNFYQSYASVGVCWVLVLDFYVFLLACVFYLKEVLKSSKRICIQIVMCSPAIV